MTWKGEIEELRRREELARRMGGAEKVRRQREAGKLTVRERIDQLLDPGSFHEIGAIAGKAHSVAGAGHQNHARFHYRFAWPSGDWGSLPIDGGIEAAYRAELDAAPDRAKRHAEIEERLNRVRSPFRVADAFGVEEIIDPRDTRPSLCEFAHLAAPLREAAPVATAMRP